MHVMAVVVMLSYRAWHSQNVQERIIRQLREEIDKLKAELAAARGRASGEVVDSRQSEEDNKKMQEMADMIAALEQAQNSVRCVEVGGGVRRR